MPPHASRTSAMASQALARTDWSRTPLGPVSDWSEALLAASEVALATDVPMLVWWGRELTIVGNDAARVLLGELRTSGHPAEHVWAPDWSTFEEDVARARQRVPVVRPRMRLRRPGQEDGWVTHFLTALDDGHGAVGGLLQACFDETPGVRANDQTRRILESITGSFVSVDAEWLFTFANPAAEKLLGETEPALRGRVLWDVYPGLVGSELETIYRRAMSERVAQSLRSFYPDHDRWYEVHVYPAIAAADGIAMYFRDVTREVRSEEALRQSTALLQGISDSTGDVIFAKDRGGRMQFANPAALALIGKPASEVMGKTDAEFLTDPAAARAVMENDRRVMETGVAVDIEELVPLPDGRSRVWLSRKMPNFDADGRTVGLLGVSRDITDKRRTWDRLRRLYDVVTALADVTSIAELGRVTLEQAIDAVGASAGSIALLDKRETMLEMVGMVGYSPESVGRWQRFSLDAEVPLAETVRTGEPIYIESPEERIGQYPALSHVEARGGTRASACLPLVVGGKTLGALGLSFENAVTFSEEDRAAMVSLSRQCAQALQRVRLFTGEREAREEAERAGRMKDEFLATLSHELRTPLNAILGWASILVDRVSADPDLVKGLTTIQRNARSQTQIIDDLLDMSRIINGKVRLEVRPTDVAQVLRSAIDTVLPTADARGVRILAVLDPDAGPVSGDPDRLQQVFWNLLTNAVKFTPRGGQVQLTLSRVSSHLEIAVADTGEGIPEPFLPHVFDRFRQADPGTTRRHGGLGLGLAIAKDLVELHGGSIRVKSPGPGRGSTFTVDLPLQILHPELGERASDPAKLDATEIHAAIETVSLTGLRVLVVDDEEDAREMVARLLSDRGAVVTTAGSVAEAMLHVERASPEVVVSDIGMPGEDGYGLVRRLRERGLGTLPAVALTAFARKEDRVRAMRAGFRAHAAKPVDPGELVTVIASITGRITP